MISEQDVKHIAKLARLGLTEKEVKRFQGELSKILDYIEKLKEVDVSKTEPTFHSIKIENVTREDTEKSKIKNRVSIYGSEGEEENEVLFAHQKSKKLMDLAPETKNGYLKVKSIL